MGLPSAAAGEASHTARAQSQPAAHVPRNDFTAGLAGWRSGGWKAFGHTITHSGEINTKDRYALENIELE